MSAGNLTGQWQRRFTYDGRGRLTQVGNGYRYAINGLGQRVSKSGPGGNDLLRLRRARAPHRRVRRVGQPCGRNSSTSRTHQWRASGPQLAVASISISIYTDHLNTPRLITDLANRTVWEWPLDTFGAVAANDNPSGLGTFSFNLRFPGQYYDAETGLHYNYFRDYDPSVGRYVESDPIGLKGGINTHAYAKGSAATSQEITGSTTHLFRDPHTDWVQWNVTQRTSRF